MSKVKQTFSSLDRHDVLEGEYDQPDRFRQLYQAAEQGRIIPRGAGISYAGASFSSNALSIDISRFDRILAFDAEQCWVDIEAGASLGKLFEFLTPHGLHLPVQPGHPQITIGGCIAANVHGKNQYSEGVFASQVLELSLFHPDHGVVTCSQQENAELFDLTIGGFGLTGIILSARLAVSRLPGQAIREERIKVGNLKEAFHEIDRLKSDYDMIYCWNDLSRLGVDAGRGYIVAGKYIAADTAAPVARYKRLDPSAEKRFRPMVFSDPVMKWINWVYYRQNTWLSKPRTVPLFEFLFPAVGKEFFFEFFGQRGFHELQVLLPADDIDHYVDEFLKLLRDHNYPVALTTIKAFRGDRRLLHFNGTGFNFTIEMRDSIANLGFMSALDELNCRFGGITNIIKDGRLRAEIAERQYEGYGEFRDRLHRYDPKRRFSSMLSERLAL